MPAPHLSASHRVGANHPALVAAALLAMLLASFIANLRLAGPSPIVWVDTFADESEVQRCLIDNACTLTGVSTSVPGQAHAVAWIELRALLEWLGLGVDGSHVAIVLLNSIAAVLVYYATALLTGPFAGGLAAWIFLHRMDAMLRATALYNSSILPFFGAVFVLACMAVIRRPGWFSAALAALVAAVMANIHLACVLTGASVMAAGFMVPGRRFRLSLWAGAVFAVATYAIAPPTWMHNLTNLLEHEGPRGLPAFVVGAPRALMQWTFFAVAAWVVSYLLPQSAVRAYRRASTGAIAVIVPFVAAFLIAPYFGLYAEAKYLLHVKAASAMAAALPIGFALNGLMRVLSLESLFTRLQGVVPFALALALALPGSYGVTAGSLLADEEQMPTMADAARVVSILRDEHGWDSARMVERLKTPHGIPVLDGLTRAARDSDGSGGGTPSTDSGAILMVVANRAIPEPLPVGWTIVRRSPHATTILALLRTRVDWGSFIACMQTADGSPQRCERTGWRATPEAATAVANLPPGGKWRGTLQLWLAVRPADLTSAVFMPRRLFVCGGRIVSADAGVTIASDQRSAIIAPAPPEADAALLKLEWQVGTPDCDVLAYDGLPPFFVEGEVEPARAIATVLHTPEGIP